MQKLQLNTDLLLIGGDTLFYRDFSLPTVLATFQEQQKNLVLYYEVDDCSKYGILELDSDKCIKNFLEKPSPTTTTSRKACPCFYLYRAEALPLLKQCIEQVTDCKGC